MKKSIKLSVFGFLSFFSLVSITSCNKTSNEEGKYEIKDVDFYQQKDKADRKIALRFYSDTPNVPYVGVKQYFKEFYKTDVVVEQDDYNYKFKRDNAYIKLDAKNNIFSILNVDALGQHPDCKSSNTKTFLKDNGTVNTTIVPRTIDLNTYYINVYKSAGDAYMPFSLLSNIITATNLFTVNYN